MGQMQRRRPEARRAHRRERPKAGRLRPAMPPVPPARPGPPPVLTVDDVSLGPRLHSAPLEAIRILVRGLEADAIIGIRPAERTRRQRVSIDLALDVLSRAGRTDRLGDSVDYKRLKDAILRHVTSSRPRLLESMASGIADLCLRHPAIQAVEVTVDKPGALTGARSVAVSLWRERTVPSPLALGGLQHLDAGARDGSGPRP